jgi:hypothetical protein
MEKSKNKRDKTFRLTISKAHYFQHGTAHAMKMDYFDFKPTGDVHMEGSDDVGQFVFTGFLKNGFLFLKKQYIGKHAVFYVGKLDGDVVKLAYDFKGEYQNLKNQVNSGNVMAEIVFKTNAYKLVVTDTGEKVQDLYLHSNTDGDEFTGLAFKDGKFLTNVYAKIKKGGKKATVKFTTKNYKEKYHGKFDASTNSFLVNFERDTDSD